jgi:hypothetical protein
MTDTATKAERAAITKACDAVAYLASATNWSDAGAWADAVKLERKQGLPGVLAKGKALEAWHKGASNPDARVRDMYHMRPGYLRAYLLGVRHAIDRADHDYNGPMFRRAMEACPAALAAFDDAAKRWTA